MLVAGRSLVGDESFMGRHGRVSEAPAESNFTTGGGANTYLARLRITVIAMRDEDQRWSHSGASSSTVISGGSGEQEMYMFKARAPVLVLRDFFAADGLVESYTRRTRRHAQLARARPVSKPSDWTKSKNVALHQFASVVRSARISAHVPRRDTPRCSHEAIEHVRELARHRGEEVRAHWQETRAAMQRQRNDRR